jgi:hypothetical protein
MKNKKNLYLINAHAPDSSKTAAMKEAFGKKLQLALGAVRYEDMMVMKQEEEERGEDAGRTLAITGNV